MDIHQELELVTRAKENIQAFGELYEFYVKRVYFYIYRRLPEKTLTEDITSQVFVAALENLNKFDTSKNIPFGAWLFKIANNKVIDSYKRNKKLFRADEEVLNNLKDEEVNLEKEVNKEYMTKRISIVLFELNSRYQEIIALRFFSEYEIGEIAAILNMTPQNVSLLLHRALKDFKIKFLKKYKISEIFEL